MNCSKPSLHHLLITDSSENPQFKTLGGKASITWPQVINLYDKICDLDYLIGLQNKILIGQEASVQQLEILHLQMFGHAIASAGFNLSFLVKEDGQFLTSQLSPRMVGFIELNLYQMLQGTKLKTKKRNGDDKSIYFFVLIKYI